MADMHDDDFAEYDTLTDDVIDLEGVTETGRVIGKFRVKYTNPYSTDTLNRTRKVDARFQIKEIDDKNPDATFKAMRVRFVELSLLGWEGIKNKKGEDVEFSKEAAHKFFGLERNRKILMDLAIASKNADNFVADEPEDVAKN